MTRRKKSGTSRSKGKGGSRRGLQAKTPRARPRAGTGARPAKPEVVVVGIGASAGGLTALKEFFRNVADDSGLAYVVVMHLSPEHESHLADLLQPHSQMRVLQVTETTALKPDCVYVIPPNANLSAIDTHLRLSALEQRRNERAPIDHFFRTLAETHDGYAIGVILTGTGSDGTLGVKEIKLRGGLTVVQDPNQAEYDGMPQSAIATGFVDFVLPIEDIPREVLKYAQTHPRVPLTQEGDALEAEHRVLVQKVLAQVKARTNRDFMRYKRSTILRRIKRRMQLRNVEELERYVKLLRESPEEAHFLADDLLITVTSFFRDREVFEQLERDVVPKLFAGKGADDEIRVWCAGCATGEEVYSIAMLLLDERDRRDEPGPKIQIFASDLHEVSLVVAREGFYPGDITTDVSPDRLARFFTEEVGGYRVRKEMRETIIFAPHNLLGDPPFSKLDLIVCRNLLIYFQRDVQSEVLRVFHYSLKPGGYLVLGPSETADDAELFRVIDKRHALYARGTGELAEQRRPMFPVSTRTPGAWLGSKEFELVPLQYVTMHTQLVNTFALPSALIGPDGQLVHLSRDAGRFFEHPAGRPTSNAVKLIRRELGVDLIAALHIARRESRATHTQPVQVRFDGNVHPVVMHIHPSTDLRSEGYSLVIFEELDPSALYSRKSEDNVEVRREQLAVALTEARERLQGLVEEFETSQEEMRASNEELQSANEELRSTMEELETSKEELQSMNEELQTVNQENRDKVSELALLSSDLQNLMAATNIATLFLDRDLQILRFTPKVAELFNIRVIDRGRPVSDLTHRLGYPELTQDAGTVLRDLTRIEREVRDEAGNWYLTYLLPYRSVDDRIAGIVMTFVDITRRKNGELEIQRLSKELEQRVADRTRQVRELTTSLVRAEQRERRRLSETLHDELQQLLYGVQLKLRLGRDELTAGRSGEAAHQLLQAETLLTRGTQVTRQLSVDLNPPILRNEGLNAILGWLQGQMKELHGLDVRLATDGEIRIDDSDARVLLFQVFRELLFNVAKHSGGAQAAVSVGEVDGQLVAEVSDDGKGFEPAAVAADRQGHRTFGLRSVRERIGLLGGELQVHSQPGGGTRVSIQLPKSARIGG